MANKAFSEAITTPVPQSEQADPRQAKNNASGFSFTVDVHSRLERFLILGTDGGTYYVSEKDLTKKNIDFLVDLIKHQPITVLNTVVEISESGRSYRNSAAIFVLALLYKHAPIGAKSELQAEFNKVVRTSTHLFEFAQYIEFLGGWGRSKRTAVAGWYTGKTPDALAYQSVKYRQRDGWTHRDLFRLAHPVGVNSEIGNFILGKPTEIRQLDEASIILGFNDVQKSEKTSDIIKVLNVYKNLPWEALPTQFLKSPGVWKKLFYNGQLNGQALVRNITRLARIRAFDDMVFARDYATRLTDEEMIRKTRLHPVNFLNASIVHEQGQVQRNKMGFGVYSGLRNKDWNTVPVIKDALNDGFHLAFKTIEPSNKRTMICLDTSGSMWWDSSMCTGLDISAASAAAAMSMTTARTEPYYNICAFSHELRHINISPQMGLSAIDRAMRESGGGGTDCSLPMLHASKNKIEVDTFVIFTDSETWFGGIHPHIALQDYRNKMGIDAKLIVAGVSATAFTIADPTDRGMLDCIGFDSNAPKVIADFSAGRF